MATRLINLVLKSYLVGIFWRFLFNQIINVFIFYFPVLPGKPSIQEPALSSITENSTTITCYVSNVGQPLLNRLTLRMISPTQRLICNNDVLIYLCTYILWCCSASLTKASLIIFSQSCNRGEETFIYIYTQYFLLISVIVWFIVTSLTSLHCRAVTVVYK